MRYLATSVLMGALLTSCASIADDKIVAHGIEEALVIEENKAELGTDIKFYFGDQKTPTIIKTFSDVSTKHEINSTLKSYKGACQAAFVEALKTLRDRAIANGANAVVNIRSNYKGPAVSSEKTFQCASGYFVTGVSLIGTVVSIEK